jgi:hypothetical protein
MRKRESGKINTLCLHFSSVSNDVYFYKQIRPSTTAISAEEAANLRAKLTSGNTEEDEGLQPVTLRSGAIAVRRNVNNLLGRKGDLN